VKANSFVLPVLVAAICPVLAGHASAQPFKTLHAFTVSSGSFSPQTNTDGLAPNGALAISGNNLYGTASAGGSSGYGTIFTIRIDGTEFRTIYSFTGGDDGAVPNGLFLVGETLYGTTFSGGPGSTPDGNGANGSVFSVRTDGSGFSSLHTFTAVPYETNSDGASPSSLVVSGSKLYGTANFGGGSGVGTVFTVNTDGTGFGVLHSFATGNGTGNVPSGLLLSGATLYGTAGDGGPEIRGPGIGVGSIFKLQTDSSGFADFGIFDWNIGWGPSGLTLSVNTLFGTTAHGGVSGNGIVFAANSDGTGFVTLHSFTALSNSTNSDGASPFSGLLLSGNTLYGTTSIGGSAGYGTVFAVNTDGTGFTTLHSFAGGTEGANPSRGGLILSGNTLYGTTYGRAAEYDLSGIGTVFAISLPPTLTFTSSGANLLLSWPTNFTGFTLQSTTNFSSSTIWTTNLPSPVVVNGQNTVTNPFYGTQQFFRLSQ
jgi:uncharacterized repeat protein (TIGR03803 family)